MNPNTYILLTYDFTLSRALKPYFFRYFLQRLAKLAVVVWSCTVFQPPSEKEEIRHTTPAVTGDDIDDNKHRFSPQTVTDGIGKAP